MAQYRLTDRAAADLDEIWYFVALDSIGNANNLIDAITGRFISLAEQPRMGRLRPELGRDLRSFVSGNYVIIYRPTGFGAQILRVIHGRRDPGTFLDA